MAGADQIRQVREIVKKETGPCVVVVSALGGITDKLKELANQAMEGVYDEVIGAISDRHRVTVESLLNGESRERALEYVQKRTEELDVICRGIHMLQELSDRSLARVLSYGELVSSFIVNEAFSAEIPDCERFDARSLICTDDRLMKANVYFDATAQKISEAFNPAPRVAIIPGFIAATDRGVTSTLGRGGSDYTAALFAAALNTDVLEIWSDVNGMLSANPKSVPQAVSVDQLSYNEAFELSHFGAKVLYPPAIQPAYEKSIPVLLKNTFDPDSQGTRISEKSSPKPGFVAGISSIDEVVMVNLTGIGMIGVPGYSSRVFAALHAEDINVIMIAQSCSERGICVAIDSDAVIPAQRALNVAFDKEIRTGRIDVIKVEENLSIIALVGDGMKYRSGVSGRIFSVLGNYGINIRAIAQGSSESNISIVLDSIDENRALQVLHETFFEKKPIVIHLFIVGAGTVGKAFLDLIDRFGNEILERNNYKMKVCALANSRKMIMDSDGLNLENISKALDESETRSNLDELMSFARSVKVPNKVLVDNTASDATSSMYKTALENGIHVVTCNKIVASGDNEYFQHLKKRSDSGPARYYYETNVGAALPVLHTLADMVRSGDQIERIEAAVSGSLGFIYDRYDGSVNFVDVVKEALDLGYTEPNPYIDLSGLDVKRKLVILARAAGYEFDIDNVDSQQDLPSTLHAGLSGTQVMEELKANEAHFKSLVESADKAGKKLKYIGTLENGKLEIGLQAVDQGHPFFALNGTDNMVAIYSKRYADSPLVIQGAGAGPELTASGVLSDVLRIDYES